MVIIIIIVIIHVVMVILVVLPFSDLHESSCLVFFFVKLKPVKLH